MRLVIQRVSKASVSVDNQIVGEIGQGFVILVGVTHTDTEDQARWLAQKVASLRVFEDNRAKMNLSLQDVGGAALVVSQFTLYASVQRGRRPGFTSAARPEVAEPLVERFGELLREQGIPVETGVFGAVMRVEIHNDGPVTLVVDR